MMNEYGYEDEKFDRVCENALNGVDPVSLTDEEMVFHRRWVAEHWEELNNLGYEER